MQGSINWQTEDVLEIASQLHILTGKVKQSKLAQQVSYYKRMNNESMLSKIVKIKECITYLEAKDFITKFEGAN